MIITSILKAIKTTAKMSYNRNQSVEIMNM